MEILCLLLSFELTIGLHKLNGMGEKGKTGDNIAKRRQNGYLPRYTFPFPPHNNNDNTQIEDSLSAQLLSPLCLTSLDLSF